MYTGGTTGMPKGVLLDQRAEMLNLYHVIDAVRFQADDDRLAADADVPCGLDVHRDRHPGTRRPRHDDPLFDPPAVMAAVDKYQPKVTVMVPTMIGMVMAHPEFTPARLGSFRTLVYGASPMPQTLLEKLLAMYPGMDILQGYGMTESASIVTILGPEEHRAGGHYLQRRWRPPIGVVLSIQDEDGNEMPTGEVGEVCVRGGNYMIEYWNKPEATTEVFRGGWYHSGDAGYLDEEGYLYLVDRVKDMIVTGGENVYFSQRWRTRWHRTLRCCRLP